MKNELKIEKVPITDLIPYENNAKEHTPEHITQIIRSIREFGFNDPIAIDETNTIIEGHGRYEALKELNYKEVPCIRLTGLSEAQIRAYNIAHNKLTLNSGFDLDKLEKEFLDIPEDLLKVTGFEDWEIDSILKRSEPEEEEYEEREESEKYCLKIFIDKKHRTAINEYIEDNGQDVIIEQILALVEENKD